MDLALCLLEETVKVKMLLCMSFETYVSESESLLQVNKRFMLMVHKEEK